MNRHFFPPLAAALLVLYSCVTTTESALGPADTVQDGGAQALPESPEASASSPSASSPSANLPSASSPSEDSSAADSPAGDAQGPESPADLSLEEPEVPAVPDDVPTAVPTPEAFEDSFVDDQLSEPLIDLAEAALEPESPPEQPMGLFPEPRIPVFPDPVEDETPPELPTAPESPVPPPSPVSPPPVVPVSPPPVSPPPEPPPSPSPPVPPPAPPAFIRPAEEYEAPPAREPVPRPPLSTVPAPLLEVPEPGITFSRVVRATVGQLVEIPFRGTGWVYLGELGSRPGIVYGSRRLESDGQSFIFRTEAPGTYGLKFYKQDFVRDYILNDHVQVIVGEPPEAAAMGWFNPAIDRGRVIAEPRWPSALEEAMVLNPPPAAVVPGGAGGAQGAAVTPGGAGGAQGVAVTPGGIAVTPGGVGGAQGVAVTPGGAGGAQGVAAAPGGAGGAQGVAAAPGGAGGAQGVAAAPGGVGGAQGVAAAPGGAGGAQGVAAAPGGAGGAQGAAVTPGGAGGAQGVAAASRPIDEGVIPIQPAAAVGPQGSSGGAPPGDYPERARQEFEAGRVASAISILDQFRERYPSGSDEAWWLYGQFYEANSPSRDVRTALDYYRRLVREYPQSRRYNDARRRIAYLERYYINIR